MRWSHGGVQEILTLRALRSTLQSWADFFATAPQTQRPTVRTLTYAAAATAHAVRRTIRSMPSITDLSTGVERADEGTGYAFE